MKRVTKKIVLAGLLAVAIVAPATLSAFSFSLTTLQDIKKSSYFTGIQRCFSNLFALMANQQPIITKQTNHQVPFVAKNPQTQKSVNSQKIDKTDTPTFDVSTFKFTPKKTTTDQYVKTADQTEKEQTKKFFSEGGLAPDAVIPEINKTIALMRKNSCMIGTKTIKCFTRGRIQLMVTIEKAALDRFWLKFLIRENDQIVGYRVFPILFENITEKTGNSYERMRMDPGKFRVIPEYGQKGIGLYLFSLQNKFLQSQKNALGEIFPCPEHSCMLPTLKTYYGSFGFIEHPGNPHHMIISFRDGKLDPAIDLFKTIYDGDITTVEKLLKNGLSFDTTLDDIPVLEAVISKNRTDILRLLITKYNALKNPNNLSQAIKYALNWDNIDLLKLLIKDYGVLQNQFDLFMVLKHALVHKRINVLNLLITKYDVLKNPNYLDLVIEYTIQYPYHPELHQIYEKAAAVLKQLGSKLIKKE